MPELLTWTNAQGKLQWAERRHIVFERDTWMDPLSDNHLNVILLDCGTWVLEKATLYQCKDDMGYPMDEWEYHLKAHEITEGEAIQRLQKAGHLLDEEWPQELRGRIGSRSSVVMESAANPPFRSERIDHGALNSAIREHLKEHPERSSIKEVTKAVSQRLGRHVSVGSVQGSNAWGEYQAQKKAQRSHSVRTLSLHEGFDPADRLETRPDTSDIRDTIWHESVQTATPHTRGQLNHLQARRDELIEYLIAHLQDFKGSPEDRLDILALAVRSWLDAQGFPDEGSSYGLPPRSRRSRE